jgi:hypothetical protein
MLFLKLIKKMGGRMKYVVRNQREEQTGIKEKRPNEGKTKEEK